MAAAMRIPAQSLKRRDTRPTRQIPQMEVNTALILTIANQRGGAGKTTTAAALAQAAAYRGEKTLAIDLDPQGSLSFFLAANTTRPGAFEMLEGKPAAEVTQTTAGGLDVIAASWDLQTITSSRGSARRLKTALAPIAAGYDLIVIDTPPTAGELQLNALMASDSIVIPLQADVIGLQGLYQLSDTARQIQTSNHGLKIAGYILTRHGGRSTLARQMAETIQQRAQEIGIPFLMAIREAVAIREAQTLQRSLYEYAPNSKPAIDYMQLLDVLTA